jgi:hypothetical protein
MSDGTTDITQAAMVCVLYFAVLGLVAWGFGWIGVLSFTIGYCLHTFLNTLMGGRNGRA